MLKSIERAALKGFMGAAQDIIHAGTRRVERCEAIGVTDPKKPYAGVVETMSWRAGGAMVYAGERLELGVNWLAMRLGHDDGEVSGLVARDCAVPLI